MTYEELADFISKMNKVQRSQEVWVDIDGNKFQMQGIVFNIGETETGQPYLIY